MAKLIPDVRLSRARIAQHDEYMRDVLENAQVCPGIQLYLTADLAAFRTVVEAEHALVSRPLRWELTPAITEADQKLDKALSALRSLMKATVESPDAEAAEAAKIVLRMSEIDKITGHEQYDEESGKISAMLTTLMGEYEAQTERAGLMPYVLQLKERNERLCELLQERDLHQGEAGPRDTSEVRQATDKVYRKMVLDVNSVSNCIDLGIIPVTAAAQAREAEPNPFTIFIDYMVGHIDRFHREVLKTAASTTPGMDAGEDGEDSSNGEGGSTTTPSEPGTPSSPSEPTNPSEPSNPGTGGGTNGGSTGSGSTETPTDPTKILLLFNDGAHNNVILKRMEVAPGYQLQTSDLPDGYVYAFKADDQADIDAASPGDTVWVTLAPRG